MAGNARGCTGLLLALAACTQAPGTVDVPPSPPSPLPDAVTSVQQEGQGMDFEERHLTVGQPLDIVLPGNASTGYQWELRQDGQPVLQRGVPPVVIPERGDMPPEVGAPGTTAWRFIGAQPGTAELHFVYRRSWEADVPPVREVRYRVTVR